METVPKLDNLVVGPASRDAVHIAVIPVKAAGDIYYTSKGIKPGMHVGINEEGEACKPSKVNPAIGIIDPFLKTTIEYDSRFYVFLYPGTITGLRHEWTHPGLDGESNEKKEAEVWLRWFAGEVGISYEKLMKAGEDWLLLEEYTSLSHDTPSCVYDDKEEFWKHWSIVTDINVPDYKKEETFFSCSC